MPRTGLWILGLLAACTCLRSESAEAMNFYVQPGQSIQAAIDKAGAGDTIMIYGRPGYTYRIVNSLVLKPGLILEGHGNPFILTDWSVTLLSYTMLRGLTLTTGAGGSVPVLFNWVLFVPATTQGAVVEHCLLLGDVRIEGRGTLVEESIIRGRGEYPLYIVGSSNQIVHDVIESLGGLDVANPNEPSHPGFDPVVLLQGADNHIVGSTVYGWGTVTINGFVSSSWGIRVGYQTDTGTGNQITNTIIAHNGAGDIASLGGSVDVSYSLLDDAGASDPRVVLGPQVQLGVNPQFVDPTVHDFRLRVTSPAIDTGRIFNNRYPFILLSLDDDGTPPDLGALPFDQRLTRTH